MAAHTAQISLGSNLGDRENAIEQAIIKIAQYAILMAQSETIETEAIGFVAPPFLNKVVTISTALTPIALLDFLQNIEKQLGRSHKSTIINGKPQYQSRVIDLDILTYDNVTVATERLTLPHPQIITRPFVKRLMLAQSRVETA